MPFSPGYDFSWIPSTGETFRENFHIKQDDHEFLLFNNPTPPTILLPQTARPSLGTLGPLLQQPGLASQIGLRTPLAPIPRTALAAACPYLSARPMHPVKTAARTPARGHGSAHGWLWPGLSLPSLPLPVCLSP